MKQQHTEETPNYTVKTNIRRKHVALVVDQDGNLMIKAPPNVREKDIDFAITQHMS